MAPIRKRNFATHPREAALAEYKGAHERIDYDPDIKWRHVAIIEDL
jgi:hypothetical protein